MPNYQKIKQINSDELQSAFEAFNELSERLEIAYGDLESQVVSLKADLKTTRIEKERLANKLAGLMAQLPVGVVLVDSANRLRELNPAAHRMLNQPDLDVDWNTLCAESFTQDPVSGDLISLQRQRYSIQTTLLGDGSTLVVFTDTTDLHDLQEQQARNQRLVDLGEMSARVAHQIRTPVAAAMLYASSLPALPAEAMPNCANNIVRSLEHLNRTLKTMLEFTKGNVTESYTQIRLASVFKELATLLQDKHQHILAIDPKLEHNDFQFLGNLDALTGVFINLVDNALESGASCVRINLVANDTKQIEIQVVDNGRGIATPDQDKVFEPFYTSRAKGTGLGLAIAKSVLGQHAGAIKLLRSNAQGSVFALYVPIGNTDSSIQQLPSTKVQDFAL